MIKHARPFAIGGLVLIVLDAAARQLHASHEPWWLLLFAVLRDLGIALLIAVIVTIIYERAVRDEATKERLKQFLDKVIGDFIDPVVWSEIQTQLLEKTAIRRETSIRLALQRRDGVPSGQRVLRVQLQYRLASLRSRPAKERIHHFLDRFMSGPGSDLPKFNRIEIDNVRFPSPADGNFDHEVELKGRDAAPVPILLDRDELVYVPGSYNLIMSELTDLESIALDDCPDGLKVVVNCIFGDKLPDANLTDKELTLNHVVRPKRYLLPGQGLEFRFTEISETKDVPSRAAGMRNNEG